MVERDVVYIWTLYTLPEHKQPSWHVLWPTRTRFDHWSVLISCNIDGGIDNCGNIGVVLGYYSYSLPNALWEEKRWRDEKIVGVMHWRYRETWCWPHWLHASPDISLVAWQRGKYRRDVNWHFGFQTSWWSAGEGVTWRLHWTRYPTCMRWVQFTSLLFEPTHCQFPSWTLDSIFSSKFLLLLIAF